MRWSERAQGAGNQRFAEPQQDAGERGRERVREREQTGPE